MSLIWKLRLVVDQFGIVYCEYHYIGFSGIYAIICVSVCNKISNEELKQKSFYSNLIRPSSGNMLRKKFMKKECVAFEFCNTKRCCHNIKKCYVANFQMECWCKFFPWFFFYFHPRMFVPLSYRSRECYYISFIYHSYSVIASVPSHCSISFVMKDWCCKFFRLLPIARILYLLYL